MLSYSRVDAQCIPNIRPYFAYQPYRSCDYTAGVTYMWRTYFHTEYAVDGGMLFLRTQHVDGHFYHLLPTGAGNVADALSFLSPEEDGTLRFAAIPIEMLDTLRAVYGEDIAIVEERRWADYLYPREALSTYRGKKLAGQRNHVNRFLKEQGGYLFEPVTADSAPAIRSFLLDNEQVLCKDHPVARAEYGYMLDLAEHIDVLGLSGGVLRLPSGSVVGVSLCSALGDTLYMHAEKALHAVNGASQLLCRECAAHAPEGVLYINREDDMGDEGLRTAKLALHPCALLNKYTVTVKLGR